jgi:predicted HD superfamily hydrolase involved in NAD metabolism
MRRIDLRPYIPAGMHEKLKAMLKPKRFEHSIGVARTAVYLAKKYGVNPAKAALAGFLHDCTKDFTAAQEDRFIIKYGIKIDSQSKDIRELWHAFTAPYGAGEIFGIRDREVLDALRNHTAGKKGMGLLAKIIYVADYTEYNREYRASARLRKLLEDGKISLDVLVCNVLKDKLNYLIGNGSMIHTSAIELWNELHRK